MTTQQELKLARSVYIENPRPLVIVKYVCIECGTVFESFGHLRRHIFNSHFCSSCEFFFVHEYLFASHMSSHPNQTKCPYCPGKQMFQYGDDLTSHFLALHPERRMDIYCSQEECTYKDTGLTHILADHLLAHLVEVAEDYAVDVRWPVSNDPVEFWVGIEEKGWGWPNNAPKMRLWMRHHSKAMEQRLGNYKREKENNQRLREEKQAREQKADEIRFKRQQEAEARYAAYIRQQRNESFESGEDDSMNATKPSHRSCPCYACND